MAMRLLDHREGRQATAAVRKNKSRSSFSEKSKFRNIDICVLFCGHRLPSYKYDAQLKEANIFWHVGTFLVYIRYNQISVKMCSIYTTNKCINKQIINLCNIMRKYKQMQYNIFETE